MQISNKDSAATNRCTRRLDGIRLKSWGASWTMFSLRAKPNLASRADTSYRVEHPQFDVDYGRGNHRVSPDETFGKREVIHRSGCECY